MNQWIEHTGENKSTLPDGTFVTVIFDTIGWTHTCFSEDVNRYVDEYGSNFGWEYVKYYCVLPNPDKIIEEFVLRDQGECAKQVVIGKAMIEKKEIIRRNKIASGEWKLLERSEQ